MKEFQNQRKWTSNNTLPKMDYKAVNLNEMPFKNYKMEDLLIQTHDLETPDKLEFWNEHWESQKYYDWTTLGPLKKYKQENL